MQLKSRVAQHSSNYLRNELLHYELSQHPSPPSFQLCACMNYLKFVDEVRRLGDEYVKGLNMAHMCGLFVI